MTKTAPFECENHHICFLIDCGRSPEINSDEIYCEVTKKIAKTAPFERKVVREIIVESLQRCLDENYNDTAKVVPI